MSGELSARGLPNSSELALGFWNLLWSWTRSAAYASMWSIGGDLVESFKIESNSSLQRGSSSSRGF